MLSEACQHIATLQFDSNCCSFIANFAALSSATQKCERAFRNVLILNLRPYFVLFLALMSEITLQQ